MVARYFVYTLMSNKYVCICMQIEKVRFILQQISVCYHQLLTSGKFETIGRTVRLPTCTCMCMCPVVLLELHGEPLRWRIWLKADIAWYLNESFLTSYEPSNFCSTMFHHLLLPNIHLLWLLFSKTHIDSFWNSTKYPNKFIPTRTPILSL